ncbi:MAG: PQQ-binding-like beta-propeller repeat protein [Alphaproteobacteria bacterium]|nr:PQQ-binding-like beta-propeller repeat protein [Alphaproteobacteria bacterium]
MTGLPFMALELPTTQALVPVMVNAGVAVLPAIGAALLTMVGALLRPKVLLAVLAVAALGFSLWAVWPAQAQTSARRPPGQRTAEEWIAFAVKIQRFDGDADKALGIRAGAAAGSVTASSNDQATTDTSTDRPVMYRLNPQRNGYAGGESPTDLKPVWNWQDPEDEFAMYPASLALHGDWVYGAGVSISPPDSFGTVFCLNARTGKERWLAFEVPEPGGAPGEGKMFKGIFSSPAITADGEYLVVGQGLHPDYNSSLLCFETGSGELHWRVPTPLHVESSPAIDGDLAVAGAGAVEVGEDKRVKPGDNPGYVLAVRISDGKELWTYQVNDPESSPVIHDGVVYIGSGYNGNAIVALRTETDAQLQAKGQERLVWRSPTPHPATGSVTLAGDKVLIGCATGTIVQPGDEGVVIAFDRQTGQELWRTDSDVVRGAVFAPIAVRDNVGIVAVGNGEVVAIDLDHEGELIWRARPNDTTPVLAGVAYTGEYVYAVTNDGHMAVLDAEDGSRIGEAYLNRPDRPGELRLSVSGPVVRDNRLYVGSETGGIHCFEGTDNGAD